jgi:hypothetical protein
VVCLFIKKGTSHPAVGAIGYMLLFVVLSGLASGLISLMI